MSIYKRYNICIKVRDERYLDSLLISLARQGYDVYIGDIDNDSGRNVAFTIDSDDCYEIKD